MRPSRPPNWGMAGSSTSHGSWHAIHKPFVKASMICRARTMRQRGASAKKGGAPAAHRGAAESRSEPALPVTGVYRWRSDACRRAVDQRVAARVVPPADGAGHARQSPYHSAAATHTHSGLPHGAEEKDHG